MSAGIWLFVVLIVMLLLAVPGWPHSRRWTYAPVGGLGVLALVVAVILVMDRV
jgi:hypothetical protein